jgi:uncharacterized protein YjgD (DUF1641 family)
MKITKSQLKQIIKEELENTLNENEEQCNSARDSYLDEVASAALDLWNSGPYKENCPEGTSLESLHQDLVFFLASVRDGRAEVPKTGGRK